MPSPFPGMDPYFEDPAFWEGFHDVLVTECMYAIEARLPEGYISDLRERSQTISRDDPAAVLYIPDVAVSRERDDRFPSRKSVAVSASGTAVAEPLLIPAIDDDIEVTENYIEIYRMPDRDLVTAIEVLSPWNKFGRGIAEYRGKRQTLVRHGIHIVELDLLRRGRRTELARPLPTADYYAMLFRANLRPDVEVYSWTLRDPLPTIPIPLQEPDPDIKLDLAAVVNTVYERGRYARKLRYAMQIPKPSSKALAEWVDEKLRAAALR